MLWGRFIVLLRVEVKPRQMAISPAKSPFFWLEARAICIMLGFYSLQNESKPRFAIIAAMATAIALGTSPIRTPMTI